MKHTMRQIEEIEVEKHGTKSNYYLSAIQQAIVTDLHDD